VYLALILGISSSIIKKFSIDSSLDWEGHHWVCISTNSLFRPQHHTHHFYWFKIMSWPISSFYPENVNPFKYFFPNWNKREDLLSIKYVVDECASKFCCQQKVFFKSIQSTVYLFTQQRIKIVSLWRKELWT